MQYASLQIFGAILNHSMTPSNEEALFALALAKPVVECADWLHREGGDARALRQRHEALLVAHEQSETLRATKVDAEQSSFLPIVPEVPDEAVGRMLGGCLVTAKRGAFQGASLSGSI